MAERAVKQNFSEDECSVSNGKMRSDCATVRISVRSTHRTHKMAPSAPFLPLQRLDDTKDAVFFFARFTSSSDPELRTTKKGYRDSGSKQEKERERLSSAVQKPHSWSEPLAEFFELQANPNGQVSEIWNKIGAFENICGTDTSAMLSREEDIMV
uniref:SFRICE_034673 n=1 Tax=Spodoptera frugiperda TaxID=7108 RepID=A0A2H1VEE2_SPOFR